MIYICITFTDDIIQVSLMSKSQAAVQESTKITRQVINTNNIMLFIQHLKEPNCEGRNTEGNQERCFTQGCRA